MSMEYMEGAAQLVYCPLWYHEAGRQQGYGNKIPTPYKVRHNTRLYRVYAVCWSNAATHYILPGGKPLYIASGSMVWPQGGE